MGEREVECSTLTVLSNLKIDEKKYLRAKYFIPHILMVELKQAAAGMEPTIGLIAVIKNLIDNSRGGQKSEATIILGRTVRSISHCSNDRSSELKALKGPEVLFVLRYFFRQYFSS